MGALVGAKWGRSLMGFAEGAATLATTREGVDVWSFCVECGVALLGRRHRRGGRVVECT